MIDMDASESTLEGQIALLLKEMIAAGVQAELARRTPAAAAPVEADPWLAAPAAALHVYGQPGRGKAFERLRAAHPDLDAASNGAAGRLRRWRRSALDQWVQSRGGVPAAPAPELPRPVLRSVPAEEAPPAEPLPQELLQQAQELGQRHAAQAWRRRPANKRELGAVLDLRGVDAYRAAFAAARGRV